MEAYIGAWTIEQDDSFVKYSTQVDIWTFKGDGNIKAQVQSHVSESLSPLMRGGMHKVETPEKRRDVLGLPIIQGD